MSTVTIDAELLAQLTCTHREVTLAGPDGRPAGYFVPPEMYESMRQALYDRAFAEITAADVKRALADPRRHTMEEVLKLVEGN